MLELLQKDHSLIRWLVLSAPTREQPRRDGKPIPPMDIWMAALALQHQQPIISRDTHFDLVAGVTRIEW